MKLSMLTEVGSQRQLYQNKHSGQLYIATSEPEMDGGEYWIKTKPVKYDNGMLTIIYTMDLNHSAQPLDDLKPINVKINAEKTVNSWDDPSVLESMFIECDVKLKTLKDAQIKLTDDERAKVLAAKAIWHHGKNGEPSPAIKKAVVRGQTYYFSNTHRCYTVATSLDKAIKDFFKTVEPSS